MRIRSRVAAVIAAARLRCRPDGSAELLLWEGRLDEMRRLLREIWRAGSPDDQAAALREHWRLDSVIIAAEEVGPVLDQAGLTAPDDPCVWLALRVPGDAIRALTTRRARG